MHDENRTKFRMSAFWAALTGRTKGPAQAAPAPAPAKLPLISDILSKTGREPPVAD